MWNKIKDWFVNSGVYAVGGAIVGAIAVWLGLRGNRADFAKLRNDYQQLVREFDELGKQLSQLRAIKSDADERIAALERQLDADRQEIADAGKQIASGGHDVAKLQNANQRLREWLQRYGEEIKNISSDQ